MLNRLGRANGPQLLTSSNSAVARRGKHKRHTVPHRQWRRVLAMIAQQLKTRPCFLSIALPTCHPAQLPCYRLGRATRLMDRHRLRPRCYCCYCCYCSRRLGRRLFSSCRPPKSPARLRTPPTLTMASFTAKVSAAICLLATVSTVHAGPAAAPNPVITPAPQLLARDTLQTLGWYSSGSSGTQPLWSAWDYDSDTATFTSSGNFFRRCPASSSCTWFTGCSSGWMVGPTATSWWYAPRPFSHANRWNADIMNAQWL